MIILLDDATEVAPVVMHLRPYPANNAPTFDVTITNGTAKVELYQGNEENLPKDVGIADASGIYNEAGVCNYVGAAVTAMDPGTVVRVTIADNWRF